jgi:hypothetical protein
MNILHKSPTGLLAVLACPVAHQMPRSRTLAAYVK